MMDRKIKSLSFTIACLLSDEKAYNLPKLCLDYDLQENIGDDDVQEAYRGKIIYILNRLSAKNADFIVTLAEKLVKDFGSDNIGNSLNDYFDGNYFKISKITRQNIAKEIDKIIGENANVPINSLDKNFIQFIEDLLHPVSKTGKITKEVIDSLNYHLQKDGFQIIVEIDKYERNIYRFISDKGFSGKVKNIIFAANGPKPEIVLSDALNNNIQIAKNNEYCLVYDKTIPVIGLKWVDLVKWWSDKNGIERNADCARDLLARLRISISSPPEFTFFDTYYREYAKLKNKMPALLPQVYLHYDPYSMKRHGFKYLLRQRMDFLLLLNNNKRIVIEIDGVQHYSESDKASPKLYSSMVSADRELKLLGYEVYRFGGFELNQESANETIKLFFDALFEKHEIK